MPNLDGTRLGAPTDECLQQVQSIAVLVKMLTAIEGCSDSFAQGERQRIHARLHHLLVQLPDALARSARRPSNAVEPDPTPHTSSFEPRSCKTSPRRVSADAPLVKKDGDHNACCAMHYCCCWGWCIVLLLQAVQRCNTDRRRTINTTCSIYVATLAP